MRSGPLARRALALVVAAALPAAVSTPAAGAGGDIFDRGNRWCASTHPNHGTLDGFGPALDLGSPTDFRWPVYSPGAGRVRIRTEGWGSGWGKSVVWISADGRERIHLAHLDSFGATGRVAAGELIGRVGRTGQATSPHVHASARRDGQPARLVLGGRRLEAGGCYTSRGPIPPMCLGREATLVGTSGDDVLVGTAGDDVIWGGGGADRIRGRGGDDLLCGGRGADVLLGGRGADVLVGGGRPDILRGHGGPDRLLGGRGGDGLWGGPGADELFGGRGPDRLTGGPGDDALDGGQDLDLASFSGSPAGVEVDLALGTALGPGSDTLTAIEDLEGSALEDSLAGDAGANRLHGMAGDDVLDGGDGDDEAHGSEGHDACRAEVVTECEADLAP